ncbi:nuclear pore complex assembly-domain-containing protein [Phellopilus nigrolimitatus]|nr:nuclear pore complex assembly-domain-containing protein [Phellopilus nigrolimitatus]
MDVDMPDAQQNDELYTYFALRPEEFAWAGDIFDQVQARRKAMSGVLFFDILLQLGGIDNVPSLYPPANLRALKRLLKAVEGASYDSMKRDCLMYYLLKWQMDGREVGYADEKCISPHYAALADAYWLLDTGFNLDNALSKLSDARIVKDYTTKIIETLNLSPDSGPLIRRFVRTCKPALRERCDLVAAWQYQRTFPDNFPTRKDLIHKLLTWALTPKPKQQPLTQLLSVPFSRYEEFVVQDFARNPPEDFPTASTTVVRDMVCVRLIQSCKYVAAVKFDRQYPSSAASVKGTWGTERERIIKEVLSIMPTVERDHLETELEALGESASPKSTGSGIGSGSSWSNIDMNGSTDLGASWEEIGRRTSGIPRRSMGGHSISSRAPRTSLPNGNSKAPLFTPGASTSTTRPSQQPLSAHPTLVSQAGMTSTDFPSVTFASSVFAPAGSQPMPPRLPAQRLSAVVPPTKVGVNGVNGNMNGRVNGAPKTNAFMARNAFFEPPAPRSPSPEVFQVNGVAHKSPKRPQTQTTTRLPTPPQEKHELAPRIPRVPEAHEQSRNEHNGNVQMDDAKSADGDNDSERENLGFSIFGAASARLTPPESASSLTNRRKSPGLAAATSMDYGQEERNPLSLSVPGAYVFDDDSNHGFPCPKSATADPPPESISHSRRAAGPSSAGRHSSRKRAASPDDSMEGTDDRLDIPGTLLRDEEYEQARARHANGASHENERGSEEDDELAPLPSQRTRRKAAPAIPTSSASERATKGRSRTTRRDGAEPDEGHGAGATGRPVRRSSRLSATSLSPTAEKTEKKNPRPRKSTRTSGSGATATGKGAAKRR